MPKTFTADITSAIAAAEKQPVHLYELQVAGTTVVRYASSRTNVSFGGYTWVAKGVAHTAPAESSTSSGVGKCRVRFADGEGAIRAYHNYAGLVGNYIEIFRAYRDKLSSSTNYVNVLRGLITRVSWDYEYFDLDVSVGDIPRQKFPRRPYSTRCPWTPGGPQCNADGLFDLSGSPLYQEGECTIPTTTTAYDAGRSEAADTWNNAQIEITSAAKIYRRKVIDFSSGTFTLDYPVAVSPSEVCDYKLWMGCDRTFATCQGSNAWGPTGDNSLNFGGFLHIQESEDKY